MWNIFQKSGQELFTKIYINIKYIFEYSSKTGHSAN